MKILHVNTLLRGGAGIAVRRLNEALQRNQVDSRLLTLEAGGNQEKDQYSYPDLLTGLGKIKFPLTNRLFRAKTKIRGTAREESFEPYRFADSPFDITKLDLYKNADIIHLHWIPGFVDLKSFFRKNTKPVVWTLHDCWPFSGGWHYDLGFPMKDYEFEINQQLQLKKRLYKSANLNIVALNQWMGITAKSSTTMHSLPFHILSNTIDTNVFKRMPEAEVARPDIYRNKHMLLFIADHLSNKRKGFHILREALDLLDKDKYYLLAIGEKPADEKKSSGITYYDKVSDERKMAIFYNMADAFVIPSYQDNQPNTVMESLCCGAPVIAFRTGGIPEMVKEDFSGILLNTIDAPSLAKGIEKFFETREKFNRVNISSNAVERFDYSIQAPRYISLYQAVLA